MKWLKRIGFFVLLAAFLIGIFSYFQLKDRHPDYWLDLNHQPTQAAPFQAGFSALSITPEVPNTWPDVDSDTQYHPDKGDTYQDGNNNGQFIFQPSELYAKIANGGVVSPLNLFQ